LTKKKCRLNEHKRLSKTIKMAMFPNFSKQLYRLYKIFYFTAEGRIDFRDLVKDLANIFKLNYETHMYFYHKSKVSYLWHLPFCSDGVNFQVFPKFHVLQMENT